VKVGDLVRHWNARQAFGLITKVVSKTTVEVLWHERTCYTPIQNIYKLEVINESR